MNVDLDEMDVSLEEFNKVWNAIHHGQWSPIKNRRMRNLVQDFLDSEIKFILCDDDDEALNEKIEEDQKKTEEESKLKAAEEAKKKAAEEARLKSEAEAKKMEEAKKKAEKDMENLRKIVLDDGDLEADENESEDSFDRMCGDQRSLQEKVVTISSEKHV